MAITIVAAYDVSDDRRRARLAAILQTCGDRIQLSVFLLQVGDGELDELRGRALAEIDPAKDSLYLIRQCADCWTGVECLGQASPPTRELFWAALGSAFVRGARYAVGVDHRRRGCVQAA